MGAKGLLLALALASAAAAQRPDGRLSVSGRLTTVSRYRALRGFIPKGSPSLQPQLTLDYASKAGTAELGIWANQALDGEQVELDYWASFTRRIAKTRLGEAKGTITWYNYSVRSDTLQEIVVQGTLENRLRPAAFAAFDHKDGKGNYYEASINPGARLGPLDVGLTVAGTYNQHYAMQRTGFTGIRSQATFTKRIGKDASVGFYVRRFDSATPLLRDGFTVGGAVAYTHRLR